MALEYDSTAVCTKQNEEIPAKGGRTNALFHRFEIKKKNRVAFHFNMLCSSLYFCFSFYANEVYYFATSFLNIELQLETIIDGILYIEEMLCHVQLIN